MRIKVTYQTANLIIPIEPADRTVADLFPILKHRLSQFLGTKDIFIPQLAIDNFILNPSDKIQDVIRNDDRIIAYDYNAWARAHEPHLDLKQPWLKVSRDDFVDKQTKWGSVGFHKYNRIYVRFGKGNVASRLWLFGVDDLKNIQNPIIGSLEDDEGKWFIEAKFILDDQKTATAIAISVKSGSERQTWSDSVEIKIISGKLTAGKVTHLSGSEIEDTEDVVYELEKPIRTGPEIKQETPLVPTKHSCTGDSVVKIDWQGKIVANQDALQRDGKFNNYIITNGLVAINSSNEPITIVKVTSEYMDQSGKWVTPLRVVLGNSYEGYYGTEYNWREDLTTNFNLEAKGSANVCVSTVIQIEGTPGTDNMRRARAHKSLPQPLKIRITFEDQYGKKVSQIVEQVNKPIDIPTKTSLAKSWGIKEEDLQLIYADDTENDNRIYFGVFKKDENVIIRSSYGTYWTWNKKILASHAFDAVEKKEKEFYFKFMERITKNEEYKVWGLVDLERRKLYGLKFYLKTPTSSVTESVLIPKL